MFALRIRFMMYTICKRNFKSNMCLFFINHFFIKKKQQQQKKNPRASNRIDIYANFIVIFNEKKNSYCTGLSTQILYCFATCTGYVISNSFFPLKLQEIIRVNVLYTHKQFWSKGYLQRITWSRSSRRMFSLS